MSELWAGISAVKAITLLTCTIAGNLSDPPPPAATSLELCLAPTRLPVKDE